MVQALLDKYHREGPVITWEEEVRRTISQIRNENNVHYLTMVPTFTLIITNYYYYYVFVISYFILF
jgi:hypothetical protein